MEKKYQKEIKIGRMLKILAKRWLAVTLAFAIALIVGASIGATVALTNKVYGVKLDFHIYKVSNVDEKGNNVIGVVTDYDDATMNMVLQSLNSQGFIEALVCSNGIPDVEEGMSEEMISYIEIAKAKNEALNIAREELAKKQRAYLRTTKLTEKASLAFELEQLGYEAVCLEYSNALQANSAIPGTVDLSENGEFMTRLKAHKDSYDEAKQYYNETVKAGIIAENEYEDCMQDITELTKEVNAAKEKVISFKRNQASYSEYVKNTLKSIKVSYADKNGQTKSTVRITIAVDKKTANSEEFAKNLAEIVKEELPIFVTEKIDFTTANCDLVNVLDQVEHTNKTNIIIFPVVFGMLLGIVTSCIVSAVMLAKRKEEFIVLVAYDKDED